MNLYFADFHIHVGMSEGGKWIKIPTSQHLTVRNILRDASGKKGMHIIGLVDALSPLVIADLEKMILEGELIELSSGGYRYQNKLTVLVGAEIETTETSGGLAHTLIFLPYIQQIKEFSRYMEKYIKNINLSSQNAHMSFENLVQKAAAFEAMIIPAHIFTPHKSLYGACTARLRGIIEEPFMRKITAVELGLSADSDMADCIQELAEFTYVTNSDAHSLDKIAREYNSLLLHDASYHECSLAFKRHNGRQVVTNYGLNPQLGKYYQTRCAACGTGGLEHNYCNVCGGNKIIIGVKNRIAKVADFTYPLHPAHRPPYVNQVPLEFIPGIGKKLLMKLLDRFGAEMNIIHYATFDELSEIAGVKIAMTILNARLGQLNIEKGSGGIYGKVIVK